MPVANKLKELRHDHRMNQTEFADYLGISVYSYNRYENGARIPVLEVALQISEKLQRPVNDIFYRVDKTSE